MSNKIKEGLLVISALVLLSITFKISWPLIQTKKTVTGKPPTVGSLRVISVEELKGYDGTYENRPIYLAYEGLVYNVTEGKEYYKPGGIYHYLVGRDATIELNIAGGGIIKTKYRVVGKLGDLF